MTNDLISREEALRVVKAYDYRGLTIEDVKKVTDGCVNELRNLPAVDAEPVRHGRWIEREDNIGEVYFSCSACSADWYIPDGTPAENHMSFCPVCGARMDEEV